MNKTDYLEVGRNANGKMLLRVLLMHLIAKAVGVQFHIGGWPYGAHYAAAINTQESLYQDCG